MTRPVTMVYLEAFNAAIVDGHPIEIDQPQLHLVNQRGRLQRSHRRRARDGRGRL
jgi:hypothetical protein